MNTPKYQHLADSSNIQAIYESWSEIKRAEEWALLCSTKKDWQNVIRICQSRQQLVNERFLARLREFYYGGMKSRSHKK